VVASENVFDYVFLSPVFDSISKPGYFRNDELGMMSDEWKALVKTKVIALGGIDASNIHKTKELGFDGAAVLGAVWGESEMVLQSFKEIRMQFINSK
jgi:thiamine-phosphate pyrophosphorylase